MRTYGGDATTTMSLPVNGSRTSSSRTDRAIRKLLGHPVDAWARPGVVCVCACGCENSRNGRVNSFAAFQFADLPPALRFVGRGRSNMRGEHWVAVVCERSFACELEEQLVGVSHRSACWQEFDHLESGAFE